MSTKSPLMTFVTSSSDEKRQNFPQAFRNTNDASQDNTKTEQQTDQQQQNRRQKYHDAGDKYVATLSEYEKYLTDTSVDLENFNVDGPYQMRLLEETLKRQNEEEEKQREEEYKNYVRDRHSAEDYYSYLNQYESKYNDLSAARESEYNIYHLNSIPESGSHFNEDSE